MTVPMPPVAPRGLKPVFVAGRDEIHALRDRVVGILNGRKRDGDPMEVTLRAIGADAIHQAFRATTEVIAHFAFTPTWELAFVDDAQVGDQIKTGIAMRLAFAPGPPPPQGDDLPVMPVSAETQPGRLAGAVAHTLRERRRDGLVPELMIHAVGPQPLNRAIKAAIIATNHLAADGRVRWTPSFTLHDDPVSGRVGLCRLHVRLSPLPAEGDPDAARP